MKLHDYRQTITSPLPQTTLAFLLKENKILLAMKKRGFGAQKWNGVGGKQQIGETIRQTALREMEEEIGVKAKRLSQVALFNFYYPFSPQANQTVHVFMAKSWLGEPRETEEMQPRWFAIKDIPYHSMWPDDRIWLPQVLKGDVIKASFLFDKKNNITEHEIGTITKL